MTIRSRLLHLLVVAFVAAALGLPAATGALANGLGDLYVATGGGVDEVFLAGGDVVETVPVNPSPVRLAFTPDGRSLFAGDGARSLVRIDIESISVVQTFSLPAAAAALAHPRGDALLLAYPASKSIGLLIDGDTAPTAGLSLGIAPDILAADRRETRVVAAQRGGSTVVIVEPSSAKATNVSIGGKVVDAAIARDEGFAYVITTAPDQVVRVALDTGVVDWTAKLDGEPTGLTVIPAGSAPVASGASTSPSPAHPVATAAIVAIGDRLVKVAGRAATAWATSTADIRAVTTSDEGRYVYLALADKVVAVSVANPTAKPVAATIRISSGRPVALAAVPRTSSLALREGSGPNASTGQAGSGPGASTGASSTHVPATDTDRGGPLYRPAGPDPLMLLATAVVLALLVMVGARILIGRLVREQ